MVSVVSNLNAKALANLENSLLRLVKKPIRLTLTDNTCSMIHISPSESGYRVRLHHMFLQADKEVLNSLAHFISGRKQKAPSLLRDFVASNHNKIKRVPANPRRTNLRHQGLHFNLKKLFDQVNQEYFGNKIDCHITWGARRLVHRQNSIKLASYSDKTKTIRINPVLDRSYVPKYILAGIIYHEMLHHYLGVEFRNGRKMAHTKRFRRFEQRFRHYHKLQAWKEKNLYRLLGR
ncbi:MAG: SprT-like domain-containing protein [Deltaproteobacteria bacterium]